MTVNDLLSTNTFIPNPDLKADNNKDMQDEFRKFYEKKLGQKNDQDVLKKVDLENIIHDQNDILNTNVFQQNGNSNQDLKSSFKRTKRLVTTLINVDSRDRQMILYPKPNNFKIFLGKTYYNVSSIKLTSIEFPNTDAVINNNNNKIYWRNQQDINLDFTTTINGTLTYPVYSVELRIGSYIASSLGIEMTNKMNAIRRKKGVSSGNSVLGDYHFFVISLDIDTDIVKFTSLIFNQLPNNPMSTTIGSGVITVNAPDHGYLNNDYVYIYSAKTIAGIDPPFLIGFHTITVVNSNSFSFEVTINASSTVLGGGNTVQSGRQAPFQLLWGEYPNNVAQNIGYPLEDSFQQIYTNITSLQNIFQMSITFTTEHGFLNTYDYIGQIISIGYIVNSTFFSYKTYQILSIRSTTSILVQIVNSSVVDTLINNPQATIAKLDSITLTIDSFENYNNNTFIVNCSNDHNYSLMNDTNREITLYNTSDPTIVNDPNYDGTYLIQALPSTTSIILPGILTSLNVHSSGNYGNISRNKPLTTLTCTISNIVPNFITILGVVYTKITTLTPHLLNTNDNVYIGNVKCNPVITSSFIIRTLDTFSFLIPFQISSLENESIINKTAYIGTGIVTVSFPNHGFNSISNITNGSANTVIIQTTNNHNLTNNTTVRLSGSNTTPSLNNSYNVTLINDDTFSIQASRLTNIPINITGIIGLSNNFFLYGTESVGGISSDLINNILFNVRDIVDQNTFRFMINNVFATSTENNGGSNIFISSLKHGFSGIQQNTKNNLLNRSINLEGENYCFLTCPQLNTMKNTGTVDNIFARISLNQSPGYACFDFLSNPKIFDTTPLNSLSELEFSVVNYNNTLYEFSDLDFSFCLEITEVIDQTDAFNISSQRGIQDVANIDTLHL